MKNKLHNLTVCALCIAFAVFSSCSKEDNEIEIAETQNAQLSLS